MGAYLFSLVFLLNTGCNQHQESQSNQPIAELEFLIGDSLYLRTNSEDLSKDFEIDQIEIFDPHFNKIKKYQALNFNDLLGNLLRANYNDEAWSAVSFLSLDGFNAVIERDYFLQSEAYLIIGDVEFENWDPIPDHGGETTAPFYLVWTHPEKTPKNGFPWPWQIKSIALVQTENEYSVSTPDQDLVSSDVFSGYELFKSRCSVCHAISGEGGKIGPDLNQPMNVLQYRFGSNSKGVY